MDAGSSNPDFPAEQSHEFYRLIADFSYDWETWLNPDGSFRYVSPSCHRITGYTPRQFMEDSGLFLRIVSPSDRLDVARHLLQSDQTRTEPDTLEFRIITASGETRWIHHACMPVYSPQGAFLGRRGSNRDITDRKNAEHARRESEQRYHTLFEDGAIPIVVEDFGGVRAYVENLKASGTGDLHTWFVGHPEAVAECSALVMILDVNAEARRLFGLGPEGNFSRTLSSWLIPESMQVFREQIIALAEGRDRFEGEILFARAEGGMGRLLLKQVVAQESRDTLARVLVAFIDITERERAEERRREVEDRFKAAFESAHTGMAMAGPDGRFITMNAALATLLGRTKEEMVGLPIAEVTHPHDRASGLDLSRRLWAGEINTFHLEKRYLHAQGGILWVILSVAAVHDAKGGILSTVSQWTDITGQRRALEALQESERTLKQSQATAHVGHWRWDVRSNTVHWSEEMQRIYGIDPAEVGGDYTAILMRAIHPEDKERVLQADAASIKDGKPVPVEYRVVWADGSVHEVRAEPDEWRIDETGSVVSLSGIVQDITDRKRMENALRQSEEKFSKAFHESPDSLILARRGDGVYLEVNEGFTTTTGWSRAEVLGRSPFPDDLGIWIREEDRVSFLNILAERGEVVGLEAPFRRKDGTVRHGVRSARVIEIDGAECILTALRDITDQKTAAEALRQSEDRFRRLFDEAIEGIAIADLETGIIQDCNQAFLRLIGYERSEIIGRHASFIHDNAGASSFLQHRAEKRGQILSDRIRRKNGEIRDVDIKADIIELNGHLYLQGFFRDTTEDRRSERERESTLALLRLLNDKTQTRELVRNLTGFLQQWSKCEAVGVRLREGPDFPYYETRGFPQEFVLAESHLCVPGIDGEPEEDARGIPVLSCMCGNVLRGRFDPAQPFFTAHGSFVTNSTTELLGSTSEADRMARTRNRCNGEGYESVALFPLRHGNEVLGLLQLNDRARGRFTPELIAFLENAADQIAIALAQRQAQSALAASKRRFRDISEAAGEFMWEMDGEGRITYASERVNQILEYSPAQLVGTTVWPLLPPADRIRTRALFAALRAGRRGWRNHETSFIARTGRTVWLDTTAVPLLGAFGLITGYRGAAMDVSERKRLMAQFLQAQKMEAVGQLAGGVAHDFNNLLQVITGNLDNALLEVPRGTPLRADLADAAKAADKAALLTGQLLAFSRRRVMQPVDLDLNALVSDVVKMLRRIVGEHIEVIVNPARSLGVIHADRGHIEQVLMNLCVNARDAMPTGGTLSITTENVVFDAAKAQAMQDAKEGDYVALSVRDTGHGMDEATRGRIFEPFFTTKEPGHGTGLGLATVYGIMKAHGGLIEVESAPGAGTVFRLSFPMVERPADAALAAREEQVVGGKETILVCEDEPAVLHYLMRLLGTSGYTVMSAHDGEEALRVFRERGGAFDLALLDVIMPKLGGRGVMERIHAMNPKVRFLFTSGYTETEIHAKFGITAEVRVLKKPYLRNELLRAIRETLDSPAS